MAQSATARPPIVEFRHVSVHHGAFRALDDITLAIHAGEHTAILGPNGSGKSTLLNAILGEKIAIVSNKPQTTRNKITGVLTKGE